MTEDGAISEGGYKDSFDVIFFATGYRHNYQNTEAARARPEGRTRP